MGQDFFTRIVKLSVIVSVVFIAGCASSGGGGAVWWNPTTWISRVAPASADRAQGNRDDAAKEKTATEKKAIDAAHREVAKTGEALQSAPDSKPVRLARRFNANALALLAQVQPLTAEQSMELRNLVSDMMSENETIARDAELRQVKDEAAATNLSRELTAAAVKLERKDAALAAANANLREAYDRENALANQVRNFWFVIGILVVLWIAGNVLPVLARFIPGLAPVATAANVVAAPALAFAESRARAGLSKVGQAMAKTKASILDIAQIVADKGPEKAVRHLEDIFDSHTDADHQTVIGAAAAQAPRSP